MPATETPEAAQAKRGPGRPPKAETPPIQEAPAPLLRTEELATELLKALRDSGTPEENLRPVLAMLAADPRLLAVEAYRVLDDANTSLGTLRKAGKWIWGATWEPEAAVLQAPNEEIQRLREELVQTQGHLSTLKAEKLGLNAQLEYERERNQDLTRENSMLKVGRHPQPQDAAA